MPIGSLIGTAVGGLVGQLPIGQGVGGFGVGICDGSALTLGSSDGLVDGEYEPLGELLDGHGREQR